MNRSSLYALSALPLAWVVPRAARADPQDASRYMMPHECWAMAGWPYMVTHGLLTVLFFVLLIALVMRLLRGARPWRRHGGMGWREADMPEWGDRTRSALRILNERFARGEIDRAELEERRSALLKDA